MHSFHSSIGYLHALRTLDSRAIVTQLQYSMRAKSESSQPGRNQGRVKGGATGEIAPRPPIQGGPPLWNLFVSNKILVWKIS